MIYRSAVMMVGPFCCLGADVVAHGDVVVDRAYSHPVRLVDSLQPLQYFPLTQLQLQPPATSQATVFFSHTTPAPASSSSLPNGVSMCCCWWVVN